MLMAEIGQLISVPAAMDWWQDRSNFALLEGAAWYGTVSIVTTLSLHYHGTGFDNTLISSSFSVRL